MRFRILLFLLGAIAIAAAARADTMVVQSELRSQGKTVYTASAAVSDSAAEFRPFGQLLFDFTGSGDVTFHPLATGNFIAYDVFFTVLTPHMRFSGVSPLDPFAGNYSLTYDPLLQRIVFHHNAGFDTPATVLRFQVQTSHSPEPSAFLLLGTGLIIAARVLRPRARVSREGD